jgi:hypothetical protein
MTLELIASPSSPALSFEDEAATGRHRAGDHRVVMNAMFPVWCVVSLTLPFGLGWMLAGTLAAAFRALLIRAFERLTWAHDLHRPAPEAIRNRTVAIGEDRGRSTSSDRRTHLA